jgi:hypothetical protein
MELIYCLTRDDLSQFDRLAQSRVVSRAKWRLSPKRAVFLFEVVAVSLTVLALESPGGIGIINNLTKILPLESLERIGVIDNLIKIAATLGYIWGVGTMMLGGWIGRRLYRAGRLTDDTLAAGELRLKIDGDGLQVSDSSHTEIYSWHAFTEMSEYADYIVLWLNRIRGVVVPARALAGEEARLEFVNFAREHIAPASPCPAGA